MSLVRRIGEEEFLQLRKNLAVTEISFYYDCSTGTLHNMDTCALVYANLVLGPTFADLLKHETEHFTYYYDPILNNLYMIELVQEQPTIKTGMTPRSSGKYPWGKIRKVREIKKRLDITYDTEKQTGKANKEEEKKMKCASVGIINCDVSVVKDVAVYNNKVVKVTFTDGSFTKAVCSDGDVFNLDTGITICLMKRILGPRPTLKFNNLLRGVHEVMDANEKAKEEEKALKAREKEKREKAIATKKRKREREIQEQAEILAKAIATKKRKREREIQEQAEILAKALQKYAVDAEVIVCGETY